MAVAKLVATPCEDVSNSNVSEKWMCVLVLSAKENHKCTAP